MNYPYDDDYMRYDEFLKQYVLTERCVLDRLGINLGARLNARGATDITAMIKRTLEQVSDMIYNCIYEHNWDHEYQRYLIEKCPSMRPIMQKAMENQLLYYLQVGNLSRSTDPEKKKMAIDPQAYSVLCRMLPEVGRCILYVGKWRV